MSVSYGGDSIVFADGSVNASGFIGHRNRIINGAMVFDQRNAGASITPANSYTLDRWQGVNTQASKFTVQQNAAAVTPPAGFSNYLGVTSSSAYSVLTGDTFCIVQNIEGFNTADLDFGKASASTVTLSFRVYSSLTGTFGGALTNNAANRSYPFSYSVPTANTWTTISVTIPGDTTGTWVGATNGLGLIVRFGLGSGATFSGTAGAWAAGNFVQPTGSVSVVGTNGATFYITGVQLERGSTASSFEYRPYGTELGLCQRYFCKTFPMETAPAQNLGYTGAMGAISINTGSSTSLWMHWHFPVEMRATPTLTTFSPSATNANWYSPAGPSSTTTAGTFAGSTRFLNIYNTNAPAAGADIVYYIQATATIEL